MICTTVDLQFGKLHSFNSRDVAPAVLKEAVLASASMPVLTDPVDLPSTAAGQIRQHVDGGVREVLPLADVFRSGVVVDHIFAISTCPLAPSREGRYSNLVDILARTVDLLTVEVTKDDLRMAQAYNAIVRMLENGLAQGVSRNKLLAGVPAEIRDGLTQKSSVPVTFIAPPAHLDMDCLVFEPPALRAAIKLGRETAFDVLEQEFP